MNIIRNGYVYDTVKRLKTCPIREERMLQTLSADDMASLVGGEGRELPYPTRGRLFITDIKDNPYYLGAWYN